MAPRDEPALRQGALPEGSAEYAFAVALYTHFDAGTVPLCPEGCLRTNFIASVLHTYPDRVSKKFNKLFPSGSGRAPAFARRGALDACLALAAALPATLEASNAGSALSRAEEVHLLHCKLMPVATALAEDAAPEVRAAAAARAGVSATQGSDGRNPLGIDESKVWTATTAGFGALGPQVRACDPAWARCIPWYAAI